MKRNISTRLLILFSLTVFFVACSKEDIHPGINHLGDYYFERTYYTWNENIGNKSNQDTSYYDGFIATDSINSSLLVIKCGEGEYGDLPDHFSTEFIIYGNDTTNTSFAWATGHGSMLGEFIGNDSIVIRYSDGGLGGGFVWEIFGKKK